MKKKMTSKKEIKWSKEPPPTLKKESATGVAIPPKKKTPKKDRDYPIGKTKYSQKYCKAVVEAGDAGRSIEWFAGKIGISQKTLYNWMKVYPEFLQAVQVSRMKAVNFWENIAYGVTLGQRDEFRTVNVNMLVMQLKNRAGWKDKVDITQKSSIEDIIEDEAEAESGYVTPKSMSEIVKKYGTEIAIIHGLNK